MLLYACNELFYLLHENKIFHFKHGAEYSTLCMGWNIPPYAWGGIFHYMHGVEYSTLCNGVKYSNLWVSGEKVLHCVKDINPLL